MNLTFRCGVVVVALLVSGGTAFGQATRTWVSGVGDDVNPCSRTAPCKTFAGAISKTATGGTISVLDPGGFGAVTITKAITIDGGGIDGSIVAAGTNGVVVNTPGAAHVMLRNLTIHGSGTGLTGIRVIGGSGHVTIDHCVVKGFLNGLEFNASGQAYVHDSSFQDNRNFGIIFQQGEGTVEDVRFDHNVFDAVRAAAGTSVVVRRGIASGHTNVAFSAYGAGAFLMLDDSVAAGNAYGVGAMSGGTLSVSNSTVSGNTFGLYYDAASTLRTFGNNRVTGNGTNGAFNSSAALQ